MLLRTELIHVIAEIHCYFWYSVVTLKLHNEYLNAVICNMPVLLLYDTIRYDTTIFTFAQKQTSSQLCLPHGTKN